MLSATAPAAMSEQPTRGPSAETGPPDTSPGPPSWVVTGKPSIAVSASYSEAAQQQQPSRKPVPVIEAAAYDTVSDIQVVNTPDGGKRLKLNGEEIPLYLPEGYSPSLSDTPDGDFRILSVPFLVEADTKITFVEARSER